MKYIRTKNGIYEITKTVRTKDIIEKANSIEELCDAIVRVFDDNCEEIILRNFNKYCEYKMSEWSWLKSVEHSKLADLFKNTTVKFYGAIWTKWGLKYVAKLNNKGELELL